MEQISKTFNKIKVENNILYIIATPIGNLGDISLRALKILSSLDVIFCEDKRITGKLLKNYNIKPKKLIIYNDQSDQNHRQLIINKIKHSKNKFGLVSDAGTPLISDPGYKLVAAAHEKGFCVTAIPGPSAVLAGLACAGLPSDRFLFAGFIPHGGKAARRAFQEFATLKVTSIWFESPRRLAASLSLMAEVFGPRLAVVARELTKLHEDLQRATLDELAGLYAYQDPPRGEVVILVKGADQTTALFDDKMLKDMLAEQLENNSLRDAVKTVTEISGQPRRKIYKLAIELDT